MSAYDNIVRGLLHVGSKVQHVGSDRARAQCPVHQSRGLTLSVRRLDDRAVLHCFAGCEDADVLAVLDLEVRDLFDGPPRPGYVPPKPRPMSPWDEAMKGIGLTKWPSLDHVLERMLQEERRVAGVCSLDGPPVLWCGICGTPTSPWTCSCGATCNESPATGRVVA